MNRRCTKSTTVKGIHIPEETIVAVDVMSLNFDQKNWGLVDVNEFYPLRYIFYSIFTITVFIFYLFIFVD